MYNGIGNKCLLDIDYTKSYIYCGNTLRPALILCLGKEATSNCTASQLVTCHELEKVKF